MKNKIFNNIMKLKVLLTVFSHPDRQLLFELEMMGLFIYSLILLGYDLGMGLLSTFGLKFGIIVGIFRIVGYQP